MTDQEGKMSERYWYQNTGTNYYPYSLHLALIEKIKEQEKIIKKQEEEIAKIILGEEQQNDRD